MVSSDHYHYQWLKINLYQVELDYVVVAAVVVVVVLISV